MTRARIPTRYDAPSYYEHAARLKADGDVVYGPHLDVDPDSIESLRDPFNMARRFAHAMAQEMGEPFAWGWYEHPEGARPGVCAADVAGKYLRVNGRTDRPVD